MNLIDMLDALEAGISKLHASNGKPRTAAVASNGKAGRASELRIEMHKVGLTPAEFTTIFGVQPAVFEGWLRGVDEVPPWVHASIQILAMIPRPERRRLRNNSPWQHHNNPARSHPFSRIEEL